MCVSICVRVSNRRYLYWYSTTLYLIPVSVNSTHYTPNVFDILSLVPGTLCLTTQPPRVARLNNNNNRREAKGWVSDMSLLPST